MQNRNQRRKSQKKVPVLVDGLTTMINASVLATKAEPKHGTASCGTQVNSPRIAYAGGSVGIFADDSNDDAVITMSDAAAELVAIDILKRRKFTITPPNAS